MRPISLARDDVLQAIAVDIGEHQGMKLAKDDPVTVLIGPFPQDQMPLERDLIPISYLLKPSKAVAMSIEARDDVVVTIPVHVISEHLRSARFGEVKCFKLPITREGLGLAVPATADDHVHSAVAIDIPDSQAMTKALVRNLRRDGGELPGLARRRPVDGNVAIPAVP